MEASLDTCCLAELPVGGHGTVVSIAGGADYDRVMALGVVAGTGLRVMRRTAQCILLDVRGMTLALDRRLAGGITVNHGQVL